MNPNTIETVSGRFVDLLNPEPDTIDVNDIAWSLSRMPRFAGHTLTSLPYTVGQHSVVVVELVQRLKNASEADLRHSFNLFLSGQHPNLSWNVDQISTPVLLEALMHDSSEAYLLDVPTPLKKLPGMREVYEQIENRMMTAIRTKLGLPEPDDLTQTFVKWADAYALTVESYHLMLSRGTKWTRRLPVELLALQQFIAPKTGPEVYSDFMAWLEELKYVSSPTVW